MWPRTFSTRLVWATMGDGTFTEMWILPLGAKSTVRRQNCFLTLLLQTLIHVQNIVRFDAQRSVDMFGWFAPLTTDFSWVAHISSLDTEIYNPWYTCQIERKEHWKEGETASEIQKASCFEQCHCGHREGEGSTWLKKILQNQTVFDKKTTLKCGRSETIPRPHLQFSGQAPQDLAKNMAPCLGGNQLLQQPSEGLFTLGTKTAERKICRWAHQPLNTQWYFLGIKVEMVGVNRPCLGDCNSRSCEYKAQHI